MITILPLIRRDVFRFCGGDKIQMMTGAAAEETVNGSVNFIYPWIAKWIVDEPSSSDLPWISTNPWFRASGPPVFSLTHTKTEGWGQRDVA